MPNARIKRTIGVFTGKRPGPLVLCTAAIHGNEPAGIHALRRVFRWLRREKPSFSGEFAGFVGNLQALRRGARFVAKDLNRTWFPRRIDELRELSGSHGLLDEDREQKELLDCLDEAIAGATGTVYCLDLHTSSAEGAPFICMGDTLKNRALALDIPVPIILGIEEHIEGDLLSYFSDCGYATVGFEAGQHEKAGSVDNHESVIWLSLISAGCLRRQDLPRYDTYRQRLKDQTRGLPHVVAMHHRHVVQPEDDFAMKPGYRNFQQVRPGEILATHRHGTITAKERGILLLPLYQSSGNDGFFLARPVNWRWLALSAVLRKSSLARFVRYLPGIQVCPDRPETLLVNPAVARWYATELFHLLGYRRHRRGPEGRILVSRRRDD